MWNFSEAELSEQIIEFIVASTPHDVFQKHLLNQEVGYDMDNVLSEGHKYEAMLIGKQAIQKMEGDTFLICERHDTSKEVHKMWTITSITELLSMQ